MLNDPAAAHNHSLYLLFCEQLQLQALRLSSNSSSLSLSLNSVLLIFLLLAHNLANSIMAFFIGEIVSILSVLFTASIQYKCIPEHKNIRMSHE